MKTLLKNATVVNVFTYDTQRADVLLENDRILGVGEYEDSDADTVVDLSGKYICPGFIDGHIHIESCMLTPEHFARVAVPHGTTAVMADPHEIANVCGVDGIEYMLAASQGLPMSVYIMLPSCVPATPFCSTGASLSADDLEPFYAHPRVLGLAEVMNYVGVIGGDKQLARKLERAQAHGAIINGHAPLLTGKDLDAYVSHGIYDDHECTSVEEGMERIRKGQWVMIRHRNLANLMPLCVLPAAARCLVVTDDKHAHDLHEQGHVDEILRQIIAAGCDPVVAIRMATLGAAECFGLRQMGAVAPGYRADLVVLSDLQSIHVEKVFCGGELVAKNGQVLPFASPDVPAALEERVRSSFCMQPLTAEQLRIDRDRVGGVRDCRVIDIIPGELLTNETVLPICFDTCDGVDTTKDILKLAVIERHHATGEIGLGYIRGMGLSSGAIAASVSHDAHNLIIVGADDADMVAAGEIVRQMGGGFAVVRNRECLAQLPLPIGGLMSDLHIVHVAEADRELRVAAKKLGTGESDPFMTMAFVSLPVIPHLKMTTRGLVDVDRFAPVTLTIN